MGILPLLLVAFAGLFDQSVVQAQVTFRPQAVPLAVKSPYLNSWLGGGIRGSTTGGNWPRLSGGQVTGWAGYVRVDGVPYRILGFHNVDKGQVATQKSLEITPTQSKFVLAAGDVDVHLTFLSPIEPDFLQMSLPFSYFTVGIEASDGQNHNVQIYFDAAGEFISGDNKKPMSWSTNTSGDIAFHTFQLLSPEQYTESNGRIQYGAGYIATPKNPRTTWRTGEDNESRQLFAKEGILDGQADTTFRNVDDRWPVMALSQNLGSIVNTVEPIVFVIGLARNPVIQFQGPNTLQERSLFFHSQFTSVEDALRFFVGHYKDAKTSADAFDTKIQKAAGAISDSYYPMLALAARQTFARVEVTVGKGSDGAYNLDDVLLFMRSDRTNAIEHIFASAPFWIYVNPELLRLLLEPILRQHRRIAATDSTQYVVQDIGETYPNVLGHDTLGDIMPIEATGDLFICVAAYVRATGNATMITANSDLFTKWADFLQNNALNPPQQASSDGLLLNELTNDVNLAAKGIIALKAYGDILTKLGKSEGAKYTTAATNYAKDWQTKALSTTTNRYKLTYDDDDSWTSLYNLFADKWLKTNLFPDDVYIRLSTMYQNEMAEYGVPIDSRGTFTKSEWMAFAAALVPDNRTRDRLLASITNHLQNGPGDRGWTDMYETSQGNVTDFVNRAVVGGVYALLVRDAEARPLIGGSSDQSDNPNDKGAAISHAPAFYLLLLSFSTAILHLL